MKFLLTAALLCASVSFFAQGEHLNPNSQKLLDKAADAFRDKDFEKGISFYDKINPSDTNFFKAQNYKCIMLNELERYEESAEVARQALRKSDETPNYFYYRLGEALREQEKYDEAILIYETALEQFPHNAGMNYQMAMTYKEAEDYDMALQLLKDNVWRNPYHAPTHYELGIFAADEGDNARAAMALTMAAIVGPDYATRYNYTEDLGKIYSKSHSEKRKRINVDSLAKNDFSDVEANITSSKALDPKYKVKHKIKEPTLWQSHLLISQMKYDENDPGFWNQFYVKIYQDLWQAEQFSGMMYFLYESYQRYNRLSQKKSGDVGSFISWCTSKLNDHAGEMEMDWYGEESVTVTIERYGNGAMSARGKKSGDDFVGTWELYASEGYLLSYGPMSKSGMKQDLWLTYNMNGKKISEMMYEEGEAQGAYKFYYKEGQLSEEGSAKEGMRYGTVYKYNRGGSLESKIEYKEGDVNGDVETYHANDLVDLIYTVSDDNLSGDLFKSYHPNGQLRMKAPLVGGKVNGEKEEYFDSGQLLIRTGMKDGDRHGTFKEYFRNGQLYTEGEYEEGKKLGSHKTYSRNGTLIGEANYDEGGKQTGLERMFSVDGVLESEYDYKKGDLVGYRSYAPDGSIFKEGYKQGASFLFETYHYNGNMRTKGNYNVSGGQDGKWEYYDVNGVLVETAIWSNGDLDGRQVFYYSNGQKKSYVNYIKGLKQGYEKGFYDDNSIRYEGNWDEGEKDGLWQYYNRWGSTSGSEWLIDGKIHGESVSYTLYGDTSVIDVFEMGDLIRFEQYDSLGNILEEGSLIGGPGTYIFKYANGQNKTEVDYLNNKRHGKYLSYFEDGTLYAEGRYFLGELDSTWTYYYRNGQVNSVTLYNNGLTHGVRKYYHENGQLWSESTYEHDLRQGEYTSYNPNGTLRNTIPYLDGERHGIAKYFSSEGELQMLRKYKENDMVAYASPAASGEAKEWIDVKNETGEIETFYPNGKLSRKYTMDKGWLQGEYTKYHSNGQMQWQGTYKDSDNYGTTKSWNSKGVLQAERNWKFDEQHGEQLEFYSNGKLKSKTMYKRGLKHGPQEYYDKAGKLKETLTFHKGVLII